LGWIGLLPGARFAPLIGRPATLKCRGPVTPATSQVVYEVDIREFGCGPHPYAVADADMVADGRRIVRFTGMSLQLEGVDPADLEAFWSRRIGRLPPPPAAEPAGVPFDRSHLLEFARGKPSRAFGPRYRPFDEDRFIARLPTPPFLFIDRILRVEPEPWVLKPGGWVEAECAVAPDAWYVAADRAHSLPYCVLLEIALQPCGWLAAYMGSALKSDKPLKFRNLGGEAKILKEVKPAGNSLHTRTRLTQVSEVSDMLIEHFDFEVRQGQELVFQGSTYFGFFTAGALERQEGIREAAGGIPDPGGTDAAEAAAAQLPDHPPCTPGDPAGGAASGLAMPARALRMIDRVVRRDPRGGARGHGFVRGVKEVDPAEWFFEAHFYQDPVFPGSLGLESFIQLLKYEALQRWPGKIASHRFAAAVGSSHRWTYRGQILPSNRRVTVDAHITRAADTPYPELTAEGILRVDGLAIYRMEDFTVRLVPQ
jgi:3-hydroxymyristoyl/3-hydroxydecanoyl-(acyl carrier protein) dehydratase